MKKIGVLFPQSKAFPKMGKEFIRGLKLSAPENYFDLHIESCGLGSDPKVVNGLIEKLSIQQDIDLFTGIFGHHRFSEVLDFVENSGETLLYSDLGASAPLDLSSYSNIWNNSLELYKSTYLLGHYFSEQKINGISISSCYYDAGYGFVRAMERGLSQSKEAQFVGHFITPLNPRENEAELMNDVISTIQPDAIFGFHNGIFAREHATYLKENKINQKHPLYTLPYSVDQSILDEFPETFDKTYVACSWFPESKQKASEAFVAAYTEAYSNSPSDFALLGYENGLLIQHSINSHKPEELKLKGPRENLVLNLQSHRTEPKHVLWQLHFENNKYSKKEVQGFKDTDTDLSDVHGQALNWFNAYLCQ